jgi:hypothetical protein
VGPARNASEERLALAWRSAQTTFMRDYNDRLLTGLLLVCVAVIVVFRFVLRVAVLEAVGWVCLVFLEVYPHIAVVPGGSMYDTRWWHAAAAAWEAGMLLLFGAGGLALWLALTATVFLVLRRLQRSVAARKKAVPTSSQGDVRDLDV